MRNLKLNNEEIIFSNQKNYDDDFLNNIYPFKILLEWLNKEFYDENQKIYFKEMIFLPRYMNQYANNIKK